ncbi:MAG: type I restriction enzyme HsdR N-terminal domain-containing protein [Candidatus Shikimatogenerans sp. Tduv]|uniref:Type I restriction enzyme HsdR N-terminal domain-containing protein n=1 Tax=Candidatus Shikimatogenerans sp. Tduv TaxID=3158567 RepID=A0AAU7QRL0_9FLAO
MFKIIKKNKKKYIFCLIRKKFVLLNNEEKVRQKILNYIIFKKKIKKKYILVEKKIKKQKIDILIKKKKKPYILIECKSYINKINIKNFLQILKYNKYIKCKHIYIYNSKYLILIKNINIFFYKNDLYL